MLWNEDACGIPMEWFWWRKSNYSEINVLQCHFFYRMCHMADPSARAVQDISDATRFLGFRFRMLLGAWMSLCCECFVLSLAQRSPTDCVCMSLSVIRCTIDLLHLQWGGRRGQTKKERKKETEKEINKERAKERDVSHSLAYRWKSFRLNFSTYCVKNLYLIHREHNRSQLKTQVKGKTITVFS